MASGMRRLAAGMRLTTRCTHNNYHAPQIYIASVCVNTTLASVSMYRRVMTSGVHTQRAVSCCGAAVITSSASEQMAMRAMSLPRTTTTTTLHQRVGERNNVVVGNRAGSSRLISSSSTSSGRRSRGRSPGGLSTRSVHFGTVTPTTPTGGGGGGGGGAPRVFTRMVNHSTSGMEQFRSGHTVFKRRGRSVRVKSTNTNHESGVRCVRDGVQDEEEEKRDNALDKLFVNYRTYNAGVTSSESDARLQFGEEGDAAEEHPVVVIISGPSGVGKDAVVRLLQERRTDLKFVVTATTRPRRDKEVDGVDYFFVSRDEFETMIQQGADCLS